MLTILYLLTILSLVVLLIYNLGTRKYNYWKKQNVLHVKPSPFFGNFGQYITLKKTIGEVEKEICERYPDEPIIGAYYGTEPVLIVQCPELIKQVTTKDFYFYNGREVSDYTHKEVITQNMFFTYGDRWKVMRQHFSPLFSSAKMKNMFYLVEKCYRALEQLLVEEIKSGNEVEVRSLMARYTIDCIGSCAFGIDAGAMGEHAETNPFRQVGVRSLEVSNARGLALIGRSMWPACFYALGLKVFPESINKFFHELINGVFKARNYEPSGRNDFVDLLMESTKKGFIEGDSLVDSRSGEGKKIRLEVDDELLEGQCWSFFIAGYETSATTSSFTLYELAKNPEAQERAAEEIRNYLKKNKGLSYSCVSELPYTWACVEEALRLYPVLPVLTREVYAPIALSIDELGAGGGRAWRPPRAAPRLPRGLRVHVPVLRLHTDPRNFPDPLAYRPERFLPENRHNIKPYTYMPFGEGPRFCIGMRFAKMQVLSGVAAVLGGYRAAPAPGAPRPRPAPPPLEPRALVTQPAGPLRLLLTRRE